MASFIVAFLLRNKTEFRWIISGSKRAKEYERHVWYDFSIDIKTANGIGVGT